MMIGRTLGRLRERPAAALLLHALLWRRGHASRQAVATATAVGIDGDDGPLSFTAEMTRLTEEAGPACPPDSALMARIRSLGADPWASPEALHALAPDIVAAPHPTSMGHGPMAGRAYRVTLQNMESMAARLGPQDIAVLAEPRIVDALFDRVGGFLIRADQVDAPLGRRLAMRQARCASFDRYVIDQIDDGTALALWTAEGDETANKLLRPTVH